jgi:putative ABC transport system permease protein
VSGIATSFPSIPVDVPFVVTSRAGLQAANPDVGLTLPTTRVYVRGSGRNLTSQLQQAIRDQAPGAVLTSRSGALADSGRQLLAGRVTTVFRYSVVLVTLYAAAAGSIGLMLASVARQRDLSYLRTLGLSTRQSLGITVVEQLPPVFSAVVVGAGLGVSVPVLISPALNLSAFAGRAGISAGVVIGWGQIAALAGGISLVVLIAIVSFGLLTRHLDLATTLRLGGRKPAE